MLTVADHSAYLLRSAAALADDVAAAGPDAVVPTCPDWTVADLVGHLGVVHRWATAAVGVEPSAAPEPREDAVPADAAELPDWLTSGAAALTARLAELPDDAPGLRFLADPPPPRQFWARRQCHETTIHRVDGLAARLGRVPTAAEVDLPTDLALDGLDELLTGFLPRRRTTLRTDEVVRILVRPDDSPLRWTVTLSPEPPTVVRAEGDHDVVFACSAARLYLGLWNRGDEITVRGDDLALDRWRRLLRVRWT